MSAMLKLALILLMVQVVFSDHDDYCELDSCPDRSHTLCKYPKIDVASSCGFPVKVKLEKCEEENILYEHNYLRHRIAAKIIPSLFNYGLTWDKELAFIAQRWANQCENVTDTCRNVARFSVTQRVDVQQTMTFDSQPSIYKAVRIWFDQESGLAKQADPARLPADLASTSGVNKLTIWGNVNKVGCGYLVRVNSLLYTSYLVCNYGYVN